MYLIVKGKKPKPICRTCNAVHSQKDCPNAIVGTFPSGVVITRAERDAAARYTERVYRQWKQHVG